MLQYFYDNDLINITNQEPKDWEEAIRISGKVLKEKELISDQYIEDVIRDVRAFGPYIVIVPNVAMPHSSAESQGVLGTGIGLTIFPTAISFEEGNSEKDAKLFFMLAAKNPEAHMENIANLSELLMREGVIEDLMTVHTMADFESVMRKYDESKERRD